MKKIIQVLLVLLILTSFAGCSKGDSSTTSTNKETETSVTDASNGKLKDIENDGYIIYNFSYKEALQLAGTSATSITSKKAGTKTTYTYVDHVLSCGTYMNGELVEDIKDNISTITGSFNVTKNPYSITDLKVNITTDTKTNTKTGYLIINGEQIDINSNFTAIH